MTEKQSINFVSMAQTPPRPSRPLILAVVLAAAVGLFAVFVIAGHPSASFGSHASQQAVTAISQSDVGLADRPEVLELIRTDLLPSGDVLLWSLIENELSVTMTASSEQAADQIARQLQQDPLVRSCAVTASAATHLSGDVMVNLNILLNAPSVSEDSDTNDAFADPIPSSERIDEALSDTPGYTAALIGEAADGDLIRREYSLSFSLSDHNALENVVSRFLTGAAPCIIRDMRVDLSEKDTLTIDMTAAFYEPSSDISAES